MDSNFLLTDQERDRFATYLERNAMSSQELLKQFENMSPAVREAMGKRMRLEIAAFKFVADYLRKSESQTLRG